MKSKSFGLDIGSTSMKAVWLGRSGNTLTIESVVSAPTTTRGMLTESDMDQKIFADSVKGILKSAGIVEKNANVSIPESQVYSKIIEMPDLSDSELAAALKFELEQHIPLPLDQVKTDWQVMERINDAGRKKMNVLIVAAPLGILSKYEKVTNLIGINPQTVETEVISVHRALYPALDPTAADVIVHLGGSTTDVAIVKNGILNMIFTIPLGGIAVTRAIAIDFGIDPNQAENFKKAYGLTQNVFDGKIGKSLEPILQSIIGDIRKAILSFKEKNNMPIKQVILSGGSALLPGLHVFFANILGIQVVVGNCWEINGVADVPQEVLEDAPSYNVVFGLAIRDLQ